MEKKPYYIELFAALMLFTCVIGAVNSFLVYQEDVKKIKSKQANNDKTLNVMLNLAQMKAEFENNISFSCLQESSQVVDNNVSRINGYVMSYANTETNRSIVFSNSINTFSDTDCFPNLPF